MSKKWVFWSLAIIMAIAVFLRLWQINIAPPGLYPDEAMNGNNALEALQNGDFKIFYPENNGREGLFINIEAVSLAIFGNQPWALRVVSAIFGILTILGLYFLTKELFQKNPKSQIPNSKQIQNSNDQNQKPNEDSRAEIIALLAAFFMATSFWHINFSRIGFRAIMAPFFLVWSFYLLFKVVNYKLQITNHKQIQNSKFKIQNFWNLDFGIWIFAALSGLLFGFGFHSYLAYRIAPLLLIIPFILLWRAGKKKLIFVFLLFAFIAGLPLGIYFLRHPADFFGRTTQVSILASQTPLKNFGMNILKTAGMFFVRGDANWRHNFASKPELWWPVSILFLIGIFKFGFWNLFSARGGSAFGGKNLIRQPTEKIKDLTNLITSPAAFLLCWLVIMLIPVVISNEGLPHALRSIVALPAAMIFATLGMNWIIAKTSDWLYKYSAKSPERLKRLPALKKELFALLLVFLLSAAVHSHNQYFFRWLPNPSTAAAFNENYAELGKYLNTLPKEIPKYVIVNTKADIKARGVQIPAQTVMFVTETWLDEWQSQKNIFYVDYTDINSLIENINGKNNFYIAILENDLPLRILLKEKIPGLTINTDSGSVIFFKLTNSKR